MSGFWNLSRAQQIDATTLEPLQAARAYFYDGGTSTPMSVYQDAGLALLHPSPVESDADGRFPAVYFDDATYSYYRVRVTDSGGVEIFDDQTVPIIGQQAGSGGSETPVDLNATASTGDIKFRYGTGTLAGWVRCGGRTIGSASSGATERANSDTQTLFEFLWAADSNLSVSGGRGASAAADWGANKTIALPDMRRAAPFGLSDMGNSALTGISGGTTIGRGSDGEETHVLVQGELPDLTLDTAIASGQGSHTHALTDGGEVQSTAAGAVYGSAATGRSSTTIAAATLPAMTGTTPTGGSDDAHNNMPPYVRGTFYIRL